MDGIQLRWLRDLEHVDLVAEWNALFGAATSNTTRSVG